MIEFTDYRTIWFLLSKIDKKWKNEKVILNRNRIFEQKSCSIVVVRFKCGKIKEWSKSRIWFVSRPQENVPFILNKIYHGVDGYEITSFGDRYGSPRFGWSFYSRFDSVLVSFFCVFDNCRWKWCIFPNFHPGTTLLNCNFQQNSMIVWNDKLKYYLAVSNTVNHLKNFHRKMLFSSHENAVMTKNAVRLYFRFVITAATT